MLVVDDFGHHPSEVRATLQGARAGFSDRRVVCAFQPHRYSRTRDHLEDFATSFNDCDAVVLCDVFAAGEKPSEQVAKVVEAEEKPKAHRTTASTKAVTKDGA